MPEAVGPEPSHRTGPPYRKSTHSQPNQGECVEVAEIPGGLAIRDSGRPEATVLLFGVRAWYALVQALRGGAPAGAVPRGGPCGHRGYGRRLVR